MSTATLARKSEKQSDVSLNAPSVMKPKTIVFEIIGISPLLQNNPAEFIGKVEDAGLIVGKKVYNDEEEARLRTYPQPDGTFAHPTEAFLRAMVRAVTGKKFGKMNAPAILRGSVFGIETHCTILDENDKPLKEYVIDRRSVVINKKARILRCRPSWPIGWRMKLPLSVDTAIIAPELVLSALDLAGRIIGVGDSRPEKGGSNGRFSTQITT